MDLKQLIKHEAYRLGFSLVGVTTCQPLPHASVFASWLEQGRHGEMGYLATPRSRQCRPHPQNILPECRSVLVLASPYPSPSSPQPSESVKSGGSGRIASYASGVDYHEILPKRMQQLVQFIETRLGHPVLNRWYTDTGPILERELAQRAGLGWIGKNTCLINPSHGSYFFLAEILLDLDLESDLPFVPDRCGNCTRCLQACPTSCILPDRTLDARRCISYLTIELKAAIPLELRPLMGGWVFGCDICQQVCPWNRFAALQTGVAFEPQLVNPSFDLLSELNLPVVEFNRRFRHSPIRRARRGGYLRNLIVASGNLHLPEAVEPLARILESDPEALVRAHAAWALGQVNNPTAQLELRQARCREKDPSVLFEIDNSLTVRG